MRRMKEEECGTEGDRYYVHDRGAKTGYPKTQKR